MKILPYILGLGLTALAGCATNIPIEYDYPQDHPIIREYERCSDCHNTYPNRFYHHHYGYIRPHYDNRNHQPVPRPEIRRYQPIDRQHQGQRQPKNKSSTERKTPERNRNLEDRTKR